MKKGLFSFTIPTFLGLILLIAGIGAGIWLVRNKQLLGINNAPQAAPKNVTVTNISSDRFTVSWITETATVGFVKYGEGEKISQQAIDHRDQLSGETKSYFTHYVNVEGLKPSANYIFKIGSGGNNNLYDNQGQAFKVTTGPVLGTQPTTDIIYGQVVTQENKAAEGAIVYITANNSAPISALVGKDGMWAKPLQTARTTDLTNYITYDAGSTVLTINASSGLDKNLNAQILVNTKNDTPVPTIVLGKDEDYLADAVQTQEPKILPPAPNPASSNLPGQFPQEPLEELEQEATSSGFSQVTDVNATASAAAISIKNPAKDGEKLNTSKPLFLGQGPKEKVLTIKVESPKTYTGTVTVDEDGQWQYTPPADLTAGNHNITVSYIDENGVKKEVSRQFVVLAAGSTDIPAFEASSSAISSPSAAPRISMPSTSSGIPSSGIIGPTFLMTILGMLFVIAGIWIHRLKTD